MQSGGNIDVLKNGCVWYAINTWSRANEYSTFFFGCSRKILINFRIITAENRLFSKHLRFKNKKYQGRRESEWRKAMILQEKSGSKNRLNLKA